MVIAEARSELLTQGFTMLDKAFSLSQINSARRAQDAFARGEIDREPSFTWPKPRPRPNLREFNGKIRSWRSPYATYFHSDFQALLHTPQFLSLLAEKTQASSIRYWFDQLLWEEPSQGPIDPVYHWHRERSRWKTCRCELMVTAWVPLAPLTLEMGPLSFIPESPTYYPPLDLTASWEPPNPSEVQPALVQPGGAVLFHWNAIHGNPPNLGFLPRRAIALHFAIGPLRYQACNRFSHVNERNVRVLNGEPDFTDSEVCPLLWTQ